MLDYEAFKVVLVERVRMALGEGFDIRVRKVSKNNGVELDAMCICKNGCKTAPAMYLECFYDLYSANGTLEECVNEIMKMYGESGELPLDTSKMLSFGDMKDRVVYKLVNFAKNEGMLKEMPHRKVLDLAMIYYLDLENAEAGMYTASVTNNLSKVWGVTEEELYRLAVENTKRLMPVSIENMECVMERIMKENGLSDSDLDMLRETMGESEMPLYVLTNASGVNGAVVMFYEGVLKNFAAMMESDLYIFPSSLHEVLLLKADNDKEADELQGLVSSVNENELMATDVLSENVYRYSRKTDKLEVASYAL